MSGQLTNGASGARAGQPPRDTGGHVSFRAPPGPLLRESKSTDSIRGGPGAEYGRPSSNQSARDVESGAAQDSNFRRKKSLVRPDRERIDPSHRQWHYRNHAAQMDANNGRSKIGYMPSTTGHMPHHGAAPAGAPLEATMAGPGGGISGIGITGPQQPIRNPALRRGKSFLGRDEDNVESGINFLRRGVSMRRYRPNADPETQKADGPPPKEGYWDSIAPGPVGPWMIYCYLSTIFFPSFVLKWFGIKSPEQLRAWREKMGMVYIILLCMAFVGYITFGFTNTVCGVEARINSTQVAFDGNYNGAMTIHGNAFVLENFTHPLIPSNPQLSGTNRNPVYNEPYMVGHKAGNLLFQPIGGVCSGVFTEKNGAAPTNSRGVQHYFRCVIIDQNGRVAHEDNEMCHPYQTYERIAALGTDRASNGLTYNQTTYLEWSRLNNASRNLAIWRGSVLDLGMLNYIDRVNWQYPSLFDELKTRNDQWVGKDITAMGMRLGVTKELDCLATLIRLSYIDVDTNGCIASKVELVLSTIIIIAAVGIKFLMAVVFAWFLSWRLGNYDNESYAQRMKRQNAIENWTDDIYSPAPASYRPNVKKGRSFLPTTSRFTAPPMYSKPGAKMTTMDRKIANARNRAIGTPLTSPPGTPLLDSRSPSAVVPAARSSVSVASGDSPWGPCPFPLYNVVPQPPPDYQPFNFPLVYTICLVTAYSESFEGLRTTLDSLATTNYPNSHKVLLVIADGIVKGADSEISTPDICLSMMKELIVPAEDVEGQSYVAIADGSKRHNMAKIYAGFYDYDDQTVERSKQQRVPIILIAKCGSPLEVDSAKPGNRGKRDSQVVLMAFMQKVLFDERMTTFEYELFNSFWRVTGVTPDNFEIVLMVDADTKVFPDSLTRMTAAMVEDPEIMGLCGETKIANKAQSWVTMIQVFEYYISHHQTKGFESCFGGVTCLPGCFSAYRIKSPKGPKGYYVPIIANPDIVEHYSENVVDTLHKKNLLLLGEDRYLTTLMLMTFPKRKMMFVPSAVCKTIVPDTFKVLRSQRRRWINSTVHNLFELIQVRDLCGTFCFSMRFVVFMDLVGTLVLPAAIAFTLYIIIQAILVPIQNQNRPPGQKLPFPLMPLILLALIFGLPGVLIIITSRRFMYVLWMIIYIISIPIWNFVLPSYAFWHMDDFSWGATRIVQGEKKGESHGDAEGQFDSSHIVMKRWIEFERERRWRAGIESRDGMGDSYMRSSGGDFTHSSSDFGDAGLSRNGSGENDAVADPKSGARARLESVPLLELPAPLGSEATRPRFRPPGAFGSPGMSPSSPTSPTSMGGSNPFTRSPPQTDPVALRSQLFGGGMNSVAVRPNGAASPPAMRPVGPPGSMPMRAGGPPPGAMPVRPGGPPGAMSMRPTSPPGAMSVRPTSPTGAVRPTSPTGAMRSQGPAVPGAYASGVPASYSGPSIPSAYASPLPRPGFSTPGLERVNLVDDGPVATGQGSMRQVVRGARRQSSTSGPHAP
ncbi:chitin synthase [Malassezia cuniculi]|uniref:chitin synthase n=1 Tax=Malassezia cuniculi TaxID=948313 RepID=A0AAF0EW39_9BASI|nr:chitin synthase [Malassezia cuniculi]